MRKSIFNPVAVLIAAFCFAVACPALAGPVGGLGSAHRVTIWVPDYYGHNVIEYVLDYTHNHNTPTFTETPIKIGESESGAHGPCSPNALAMHGSELYIVCNSDAGGPDVVVGYNTSTRHYREITGIATDGNNYFSDSHLIAILFDSHGNLWVSGYKTNDLLRIPAAELATGDPKIDRQVINSPNSPAGLAMDRDNSIWIVGQYEGGIALNFPDAALNGPGTHLGSTALSPSPGSCISNNAPGCQQKSGLFNNPEGIAIFDNSIWVSNNGGDAPGKTIVRLVNGSKNQLAATTYGQATSKPFACPGGLFAVPAPSGGKASLWINDEGFDVSSTDCGSSSADQSSHTGRVLQFLATDLLGHQTAPTPQQFTDWNKISTSSPGFGGIVVQIE